MKLEELFNQIRRIEPDADFARESRRAILQFTPYPRPTSWPVRASRFLFENIQIAGTLAVMSIALLLFVNGSAILSTFSPLKFASVDRSAITAEAEAVDIQIQLTDLAYHEPVTTSHTTAPTTSKPLPAASKKAGAAASVTSHDAQPKATDTLIDDSSASSALDDALDVLAE